MGQVAWHTVTIYLFLLVSFRFAARRILGQLTVIDLIAILLMGSAVETAMVAGNLSLPAGIVCSSVLFVCTWAVGKLIRRTKRTQALFGGNPIILVQNGKPIQENLLRFGLSQELVEEAIRERGTEDLAGVKYAVMETDGEITVVNRTHRSVKSSLKVKPNS